MKFCFKGYSTETYAAILLFINAISCIVLLKRENSEFLKVIANENDSLYWYLILFEAILSLFTFTILIIFKKSTSNIVIGIEIRLFGFILVFLTCEILGIISFVIYSVLQRRDFNDIWKIAHKSKTNEPMPDEFRIILSVLLICYFVLKLQSGVLALVFASDIAKRVSSDRINHHRIYHREEFFISSLPPVNPPSYDSCYTEDENMHSMDSETPPPSYAATLRLFGYN